MFGVDEEAIYIQLADSKNMQAKRLPHPNSHLTLLGLPESLILHYVLYISHTANLISSDCSHLTQTMDMTAN